MRTPISPSEEDALVAALLERVELVVAQNAAPMSVDEVTSKEASSATDRNAVSGLSEVIGPLSNAVPRRLCSARARSVQWARLARSKTVSLPEPEAMAILSPSEDQARAET